MVFTYITSPHVHVLNNCLVTCCRGLCSFLLILQTRYRAFTREWYCHWQFLVLNVTSLLISNCFKYLKLVLNPVIIQCLSQKSVQSLSCCWKTNKRMQITLLQHSLFWRLWPEKCTKHIRHSVSSGQSILGWDHY